MSAANPVAVPGCLIQSAPASTSQSTTYISPALTKTIIDKFTATNNDSSAHTLSVNLVPSGGTAGAANLVISSISVNSATCLEITAIEGHVLEPGDFISTIASSANNIVIRSSGRQCS